MTIRPVADNRVVKIEQAKDNNKTASGIILPKSTSNVKQDKGTVIAVGEGRILNDGSVLKPSVKSEDFILFNCFAGTEIVVEDESYLMIKEADILAIIG